MPTYDHGVSGLVGTIAVTVLDSSGAVHVARTKSGITEPVAGSGVYRVADHDTTATLTYVWDDGVTFASETVDAQTYSVVDRIRKWQTNKMVTSTTGITLYQDDGTTVAETQTLSGDATQTTRGAS